MTGIPSAPQMLPPSVSGSGANFSGGGSAEYARHLAQLPPEEFQKVRARAQWDSIYSESQRPMRNLRPRNMTPPSQEGDGDDGGGELDIEA